MAAPKKPPRKDWLLTGHGERDSPLPREEGDPRGARENEKNDHGGGIPAILNACDLKRSSHEEACGEQEERT